jgi:hypothetical protein
MDVMDAVISALARGPVFCSTPNRKFQSGWASSAQPKHCLQAQPQPGLPFSSAS